MSWHPDDPRSWGGWAPHDPRWGRHRPTWGWGHPGRPLYDNQLGHRLPTGGPPAAGQLTIVVAIGLFLLSPVTLLAAALNLAGRRQAIDPAEVRRTQREAQQHMDTAVRRAATVRDDHF